MYSTGTCNAMQTMHLRLLAILLTVELHNVIFHQIFNPLAQVSRLESIVEVVTQYDFTIEFSLIKPNLYYMN